MTLFLENNKNLLLNRFSYIFILTYILNAPKINDLYMTKQSSQYYTENKGENNKLKSIYTYLKKMKGAITINLLNILRV